MPAVMQHRDVLGDAQRHVEIVLDNDEADMVRQRVEDGDEIAPLGRRQSGRGLVEQNEARRAGERQRDFKLPLLTVAQRRHQPVAHGFQMNGVQDRFRLHHGAVVGARTR